MTHLAKLIPPIYNESGGLRGEEDMNSHGAREDHQPVKIGEVISALEEREIPFIFEDVSIHEAIHTMTRFPHTRLLYVVDSDRILTGTISLQNLVRHFFSQSHEPQVHPRHLIGMITTETAKDIMQRHPLFAREEENVEQVLRKMIEKHLTEIAVLDQEKRLIADVTMIDLLNLLIHEGEQSVSSPESSKGSKSRIKTQT
jgi:CBS domain-containing protein